MDLAAVAAAAEGFSGADLGALLSDAQLAAVHEVLAQPRDPSQVHLVCGFIRSTTPAPREKLLLPGAPCVENRNMYKRQQRGQARHP